MTKALQGSKGRVARKGRASGVRRAHDSTERGAGSNRSRQGGRRRTGDRGGRSKRGAKEAARVGIGEAIGGGVGKLFPVLKRGDGCGAMLLIAERTGAEAEAVTKVCEMGLSLTGAGRGAKTQGGGRAGKRPKGGQMPKGRGRARISARTCRVLAAVGHAQRVRLLVKLLEGPATYRALQRVTRLKAGPLYHHINQLRLAGLILPKQRDLYELTRGGRNLILAIMVIGPVIRDSRRRPAPKE